MGRKLSPEHCKAISESHKGYKWDEQRKKALSIRMMGNKYPLGTKQSEETKLKKSAALLGKKSHLYKGGITPITKSIRRCGKYAEWRKKIFQLDGYRCVNCGVFGKRFEAHHYIPFATIFQDFIEKNKNFIANRDKLYLLALDYEPFWNQYNGLTLCINCHNKTKRRELWM